MAGSRGRVHVNGLMQSFSVCTKSSFLGIVKVKIEETIFSYGCSMSTQFYSAALHTVTRTKRQ